MTVAQQNTNPSKKGSSNAAAQPNQPLAQDINRLKSPGHKKTNSEPTLITDPLPPQSPLSSFRYPAPKPASPKTTWSSGEQQEWQHLAQFGNKLQTKATPAKDAQGSAEPGARELRKERGSSMVRALEKSIERRIGSPERK